LHQGVVVAGQQGKFGRFRNSDIAEQFAKTGIPRFRHLASPKKIVPIFCRLVTAISVLGRERTAFLDPHMAAWA
jgi:hypothetical protein